MNLIAITIAVIILVAGVITQTNQSNTNTQINEEFISPTPIETNLNTVEPVPLPSPSPIEQETEETLIIDALIYPDSNVIAKSNTHLHLQSQNNHEEVTDWYKAKLEEMDMNITSFVTTTTNGNVENSLKGADTEMEVSVDIQKRAENATTYIFVNFN